MRWQVLRIDRTKNYVWIGGINTDLGTVGPMYYK
jgi:hypothetical protein